MYFNAKVLKSLQKRSIQKLMKMQIFFPQKKFLFSFHFNGVFEIPFTPYLVRYGTNLCATDSAAFDFHPLLYFFVKCIFSQQPHILGI